MEPDYDQHMYNEGLIMINIYSLVVVICSTFLKDIVMIMRIPITSDFDQHFVHFGRNMINKIG